MLKSQGIVYSVGNESHRIVREALTILVNALGDQFVETSKKGGIEGKCARVVDANALAQATRRLLVGG